MDKDELIHLEGYKREETSLAYRLKIVKALVKGLEDKQKTEKEGFTKAINDKELQNEHQRAAIEGM